MTRFKLIFRIVMIGLCTVVFATNALSTKAMVNRYVSPGGNDNGGLNVCTNAGNPCATIQHAVNMATPIEAITNSTIELNNTIITAGIGSDCDLSASASITGFHNLIDGVTCGAGAPFRLGIVSNLDPVLADNGGPTQTHRLFLGSNAIDDGNANCPNPKNGNPLSLDQRGMGYGRPKDGDGNGTLICDIGAFELQTSPVPLPNPFIQGIEDIILAGGTAHFQVTLTNNESEAINDALFELRLLGLVESANAQIDVANSNGVQPLELNIEDGKISWLGSLQPGGELTIEVETTARSLCNNENIDGIELNGRIGILGSDSQQSVSDSVLVTCDAPIDPNSISLTKTVFVTGANGSEEAVDSTELIGGQQAHIQLQLTNNRYSWNLYVCRPERSNKHSHNRRH